MCSSIRHAQGPCSTTEPPRPPRPPRRNVSPPRPHTTHSRTLDALPCHHFTLHHPTIPIPTDLPIRVSLSKRILATNALPQLRFRRPYPSGRGPGALCGGRGGGGGSGGGVLGVDGGGGGGGGAAAKVVVMAAVVGWWRRRGAQAKLTLSWWLARGLVDHASHRSSPAPSRGAAAI